jgi:hypothetical protein
MASPIVSMGLAPTMALSHIMTSAICVLAGTLSPPANFHVAIHLPPLLKTQQAPTSKERGHV